MTTPTFIRPVKVFAGLGDSFQDHLDRNSANPGVDYYLTVGADIVMPASGVVTMARWSSTVGFWLGIDFDNGWGADLLHNSKLIAVEGHRYAQGAHIAEGGGTGSVATGPHCHWSLRPKHGAHLLNSGNVDGEKHLTPPNEAGDNDMFRLIKTKIGTTSAGNLYDMFTPYLTLTGIPFDEAQSYNSSAGLTEDASKALDGTTTEGKKVAAVWRKVWTRIQTANLAALDGRIAAGLAGLVVPAPPPAELPLLPPAGWSKVFAQAVRDEIIKPDV